MERFTTRGSFNTTALPPTRQVARVERPASPHNLSPEGLKNWIRRYERHTFDLGLRRQNSIERVTVPHRKEACDARVLQ
jgi:hypothetical protein